ncbi:MAG: M20/M25/M40 family metallo-hydrolase [Firmicutes bacterium]|nr:M20/M25/M40 family metallo-hydrolase [Bacillota bacterium]HOB34547.1 M20/M25/M40 family metallo-hydrolase [Bacillota bacterium]HPZ91070.1 M20/M25/M40 family metallo-hydrolase [Bacillota bacterium]HQE01895.1 M20/M25/M40 family metallo-hydrolase [Bacillota bacterium]
MKDISKKIEALTLELAGIRSVVGTRGENDVAERIYTKFKEMSYFRRHPHRLQYIPAAGDPLGRKSVLATVKGEGGNSNKTLVLIGHIDTVGTSDYGMLEEYATRPLELAEKLREVELPEDVLRDLESGDYLFGRGVFDMKCGVAILMTIVESIAQDVASFDGNLVFAAVCDEEGNSAGMLSVVPELLRLREQEGFEYIALLDTDYSAPRFEGDKTRYIYVGTVGKLMPSFYVVGSEAHGGDPFKGLDPNHLSSAIMLEIDFNTRYCDEAEGEVTVPPISIRQQDLKQEYSVQTAKASYLYFNYGTHSSGPDEVLAKVMAGAETAFRKVIDSLNAEYEKYCLANGFPHEKLPWQARVISYAQLYEAVKAEKGEEVDRVLAALEEKLLADDSIDERIYALRMVETLHSMWSDQRPVVVAYFSPPYYPHVYVRGESELEKKLLDAVREVIANTDVPYDIQLKKFYPYISDLSYATAPQDVDALDSLRNNMPGFGKKYYLPLEAMQELNLPVVNIGPFGKDAHKFTERVEKNYSFVVAPKLVYDTIMKLLR